MIRLIGPLCPPGRREKETLKPRQYRHRNQYLLPVEIMSGNKERGNPGELGQHRADGSERRQDAPPRPPGNAKQTGIEQRNVAEKPQRIILPGREQHRRQETAGNAENGHDQRVHSHRQ